MEENEYVPKRESFLEKRNNGLILSDYQISVLRRNGINYESCGSIKEILFLIDEILDEEDDEELESIAKDLSERDYYQGKKN